MESCEYRIVGQTQQTGKTDCEIASDIKVQQLNVAALKVK